MTHEILMYRSVFCNLLQERPQKSPPNIFMYQHTLNKIGRDN